MILQSTSDNLQVYPTRRANSGFTLLEVVVGVSILTASLLGVLTVFNHLLKANHSLIRVSQATFLLEEGVEWGRVFRDQNWANLGDWPSGTAYHLVASGGGSSWATGTTPTLLDGLFERKIMVTDVNRDNTTHEIVASGGTIDPDTKLVTITVAWWNNGATTTQTVSTYLTNLFQ